MRATPLILTLILLLSACAEPPAEVPDTVGELDLDLGELSLWLFKNLNDADVDQLGVGARDLRAILLDNEAALDDHADREGRTWGLPDLDGDNLNVDIWAGADTSLQLPVGVGFRSAHPLADHGTVLALVDQTPVEAESSSSYDREFLTDLDCFLDGSCDSLRARETIHRQNALLDVVYVQEKEFRRVPMWEEDGEMIWSRSWTTQQYIDAENDTIDQWTGMAVNLSNGDRTLRFNTLWGSSNLALQDSYLISQVADGMEESFLNTDAWLDAN
jgi:hypothetical protein